MNLLGARLHELYTMQVDKRGLCAYDDKRYLLDNIRSLAYGHYQIAAEHIAINMHPNGPADGGMIIISHEENKPIKKARRHDHMVARLGGKKVARMADVANAPLDAAD